MSTFLLITGVPACGKTTLIKKLIQDLKKLQLVPKMQGFFTEETTNSAGFRTGFDVVDFDGNRIPLARLR